MEYGNIVYTPGPVARIELNRPRYLNAQSYRMREEMDDAFGRAVEDRRRGLCGSFRPGAAIFPWGMISARKRI